MNNNIITDIVDITSKIDIIDLKTMSYLESLALDAAIEKLKFTWDIRKIRARSDLVLMTNFINIFTLKKDNFQELVSLKTTVKDKKGIYILSFSNGKYYVGQTNNLCRRLDEYFDINKRLYKGHNHDIRELFNTDPDLITNIFFLESESDLNLLESSYIEKLQSNNPIYGYNKTGGNQ